MANSRLSDKAGEYRSHPTLSRVYSKLVNRHSRNRLNKKDENQTVLSLPRISADSQGHVQSPLASPTASSMEENVMAYSRSVESIREEEYPHMKNGIYLDHSGTTIYAKSTIDRFAHKMATNLYGNPHSANEPARLSGIAVDEVRARTLRFMGADPRYFDLIFVANATAAVKLVADAFRDLAERTRAGSFWAGYHRDCHTSLVGIRELAGPGDHHCFVDDAQVDGWLADPESIARHRSLRRDGNGSVGPAGGLGLFAYPAQSNLSGRRLPLRWTAQLRAAGGALRNTYSLLDAAAFAMTAPLGPVFADPDAAPDFVCVSFYKIFGFPDLGGLIVRKESGHILTLRKYFGGGTVTLVSTIGGAWHKSKGQELGRTADQDDEGVALSDNHHPQQSLSPSSSSPHGNSSGSGSGSVVYNIHDAVEDGTLPFHSIVALGEAMDVHAALFGSMENVSRHTASLVRRMHRGMRALRHDDGGHGRGGSGNKQPLVRIYSDPEKERDGYGWVDGDGDGDYADSGRQGATVAFNVMRRDGTYVSYAEVEMRANEAGIYIRSGGVCCPGGLYAALQYEPWELERARSAGHHCGMDGTGVIHELPTGIVRASLGPMSTPQDVDAFLAFLRDTFLEQQEKPVMDFHSAVAAATHSRSGGGLVTTRSPVSDDGMAMLPLPEEGPRVMVAQGVGLY